MTTEEELEELDDDELVEQYRELSKIVGDMKRTQDQFKRQRQMLEEQDGVNEAAVKKAKENEDTAKENVRDYQRQLEEIKQKMNERDINPVDFY